MSSDVWSGLSQDDGFGTGLLREGELDSFGSAAVVACVDAMAQISLRIAPEEGCRWLDDKLYPPLLAVVPVALMTANESTVYFVAPVLHKWNVEDGSGNIFGLYGDDDIYELSYALPPAAERCGQIEGGGLPLVPRAMSGFSFAPILVDRFLSEFSFQLGWNIYSIGAERVRSAYEELTDLLQSGWEAFQSDMRDLVAV